MGKCVRCGQVGGAGADYQGTRCAGGIVRKYQADPWAVLVVVSLGFFMTLLDLTIVNIAIPNMITKLHASLNDVLWVINAYALVLAVLVITAGRLGDLPEPRLADRVPRCPGTRSRHAHATDTDDHHEHLSAGSAGGRVRRLGRGSRSGDHRRADPGRAAGDRVRLAVDLLCQPADRRDRADADLCDKPGPAARPTAPARHSWRPAR